MPLVKAPCFAIRKRPEIIFQLDSYVEAGTMTRGQADIISQAVIDRMNIVVAGGTGSGKTTLLNAILAQPAFASDQRASAAPWDHEAGRRSSWAWRSLSAAPSAA